MAKRLDVGALLGDTMSKLNTGAMQVREIALSQLEENPRNSYSQFDIEDLAESIQVIGLQQPLVVVPVEDGHFRILAGHRRRSALEMLERKTAPCVVLDADLDPSLRTLILHWTNTLARGGAGLTGEGIFEAAKEIKEALLDLKQRGVLELPGKLRAYIADVLKVSEAAIAREDSINAHLSKTWKAERKKYGINDSVAYELSQCSEELQCELHDLYKGNLWQLDAKDVKAHKKAAAAGFAPLKCPKETYGIEPCVGTDKRAAAVKRGECPGCCYECEKADGCEWVCGKVSKANRAHAEAEERKAEHEKALAEFAASPLGRMQAHLRRTLEAYGITASNELEAPLCYHVGWLFADDPIGNRPPDVDDLFALADQLGIDPQELMFGNPEGAPLRGLAQSMEQAVAVLPRVNANSHVCVTGLSKYGTCVAARCCAEPYACCIACPKECNSRCGFLPESAPQTVASPVWHPYPAEKPAEGQIVLACGACGETGRSYAALRYRDGGWYPPGLPDCRMDVDVRWWSAALAPEEGAEDVERTGLPTPESGGGE